MSGVGRGYTRAQVDPRGVQGTGAQGHVELPAQELRIGYPEALITQVFREPRVGYDFGEWLLADDGHPESHFLIHLPRTHRPCLAYRCHLRGLTGSLPLAHHTIKSPRLIAVIINSSVQGAAVIPHDKIAR